LRWEEAWAGGIARRTGKEKIFSRVFVNQLTTSRLDSSLKPAEALFIEAKGKGDQDERGWEKSEKTCRIPERKGKFRRKTQGVQHP